MGETLVEFKGIIILQEFCCWLHQSQEPLRFASEFCMFADTAHVQNTGISLSVTCVTL